MSHYTHAPRTWCKQYVHTMFGCEHITYANYIEMFVLMLRFVCALSGRPLCRTIVACFSFQISLFCLSLFLSLTIGFVSSRTFRRYAYLRCYSVIRFRYS